MIKLHLSTDRSVCPGQPDLFCWVVENHGERDIRHIRLREIRQPGENCRIEPAESERIGIAAGAQALLTQSVTVGRSGRYGVQFELEAELDDGRREVFASDPLRFEFGAEENGPNITIRGEDGVAYSPADLHAERIEVHAGKGSLINLQGKLRARNLDVRLSEGGRVILGEDVNDGNAGAQGDYTPVDPRQCVSIRLHPIALDGLDRLDLARIARDWRGGNAPGMELGFVDPWGEPWKQVNLDLHGPHNPALYRLRIRSPHAGNLTLIVQGTSGNFYQTLPWIYAHRQRVDTAPVIFPDNFVTLPHPNFEDGKAVALKFRDKGIERVLAVVSQIQLPPLPDLIVTLTPGRVKEVIQSLNAMPSIAAYAQVSIE